MDPAADRHAVVKAVLRRWRELVGRSNGEPTGVVVACSGGADSVALLRAMHRLAGRRSVRLVVTAAHVQHHLRAESAERDAVFVEALAAELGLRFERVDLSPPDAGNVEGWAREARYAALHEIASRVGAGYLATAHHADDQLETLLMRLLRGSSVAGLRGVWASRAMDNGVQLVRPMLTVRREQVLDYLRVLGQDWREDETNADVQRVRNRLRREVIPVLRELSPGLHDKAGAIVAHAGDLEALVSSLLPGDTTDRRALAALPDAVLLAALRRACETAGVPGDRVSRRQLQQLAALLRDGRGGERRVRLAGGVQAVVTRERLVFDPA